ncbi:MAG: hypothetical protein JXA46_13135 [Dehalococcoidales bacterium]|nr:hypothetical protein [Dehalococcoidales bacterium]
MIVIILVLIFSYFLLRRRRKRGEISQETGAKSYADLNKQQEAEIPAKTITGQNTEEQDIVITSDMYQTDTSVPADTEEQLDQIISPDLNLIPDVILEPGEDAVLLILPERVPVDEVKVFEDFLRKQDVLKIVTTGGSSDEGSNIGIRVVSKVNFTDLLSTSNMSIVKHIHKKGERIVLSYKIM